MVRLQKKTAHSEWPRSRTRHLVSNVRVGAPEGDETPVSAAFVTFRSKNGVTDTYMGRALYRLKRVEGALRGGVERVVQGVDPRDDVAVGVGGQIGRAHV